MDKDISKTSLFNSSEILAACGIKQPSAALQCAIAEDSNLTSDWLWHMEQMNTTAERHYCLERALYIDPSNATARREMKMVAYRPSAAPTPGISVNLGRLLRFWMRPTPKFEL